jgi:iron complex outermembrane receptor protein
MLKKINLTAFTLLFALFLQAQQHTVTGTVTDKRTHAPVSRAVIFFPDLSRSVVTGERGDFSVQHVPGNRQTINVVCAGYKPQAFALALTDSVVTLHLELENSNRELEEVVITGTQTQTSEQTAGQVETISQQYMRSTGALSISDGIAHLPGITQLSTGAGISKPVIRGLYGNRIQTVVMGLRFDNQQWQDEHGLGLSDIGVDRVEVIKGPAALMYGSEAMGGVVNILEEKPAFSDSTQADVSSRIYSNTFGASVDAGVRRSAGNHFWRLRAGADSHGDYSDGNNKRVFNSRFDSYNGKATFGIRRANWVCVNNYAWSKSDFGFIMDTANALIPDGRLSRDLSNPHHTVFINLFTTQNTFFGKNNSVSRINGGVHLNRRLENEGGGGISLDMQLLTAALHAQHERPLNKFATLTSGIQAQFQNNTNFGFRVIVPDAQLAETSGYAFFKTIRPKIIFETGLRYDLRYIHTYPIVTAVTALLPLQLEPVQKAYQSVNGSAGTAIPFLKHFIFKTTITSGYRTPNLAELESNGVHEGTLRYEIGNPDMKIEQNFCAEAALQYELKQLRLTANTYHNRFINYIYLQPTPYDWFGFREYRFIQQNATLAGAEFTADWSPAEMLDLSVAFSVIRAHTDAGNYLPFIPADRIDGNEKLELGNAGKWKDWYIRFGQTYCFPQHNPAQFETGTVDYLLLDAGAGTTLHLSHNRLMTFNLNGSNLLNQVYYDHLSRFKEFRIYNMGRNITLHFKYEW